MIDNILVFLSRTPLKGEESIPMVEAINFLKELRAKEGEKDNKLNKKNEGK